MFNIEIKLKNNMYTYNINNIISYNCNLMMTAVEPNSYI